MMTVIKIIFTFFNAAWGCEAAKLVDWLLTLFVSTGVFGDISPPVALNVTKLLFMFLWLRYAASYFSDCPNCPDCKYYRGEVERMRALSTTTRQQVVNDLAIGVPGQQLRVTHERTLMRTVEQAQREKYSCRDEVFQWHLTFMPELDEIILELKTTLVMIRPAVGA